MSKQIILVLLALVLFLAAGCRKESRDVSAIIGSKGDPALEVFYANCLTKPNHVPVVSYGTFLGQPYKIKCIYNFNGWQSTASGEEQKP